MSAITKMERNNLDI